MRPRRQNQRELRITKILRHSRGKRETKKKPQPAGEHSRKDKGVPSYLALWQ